MNVKVSTRRGSKVGDALRAVGEKAIPVLKRSLYQEAEGIMSQSKQIVPVDTGTLRNSGFVELPTESDGLIKVEMGYGGAAAPYAVFVHEDMQAFHRVGQAKYLEDPVNQAKKGIADRIAADLRKAQ